MKKISGEEIRQLRKKNQLTQVQFGKIMWPDLSDNAAQCRVRRMESKQSQIGRNKFKEIKLLFDSKSNLNNNFYEHVRCVYPEIEALIQLLYHAHPVDASPNFEMAKTAWSGFEILSRQKAKLYESVINKFIKAS